MFALHKESISLFRLACALTLAHGLALTIQWGWEGNGGGIAAPIRVEIASFGGQARTDSAARPRPAVAPAATPKKVSTPRDPAPQAVAKEEVRPQVGSAEGNGFGVGEGTGIGTGVASGGPGDLRQMYLQELRARIDDLKRYPLKARRLGQMGVVVVSFELLADGRITNPRVTKPSPYRHLNESALNAVAAIRTFRPLPQEWKTTNLAVDVPIHYRITN